jgi:hypothetical protein
MIDYSMSIDYMSKPSAECSSCANLTNQTSSIDDIVEGAPTRPKPQYSVSIDQQYQPNAQPQISYSLNGQPVPPEKPADQAPDYLLSLITSSIYDPKEPYDWSNIRRRIDYTFMSNVLAYVSKSDGKWTQEINLMVNPGGESKCQEHNESVTYTLWHEQIHNRTDKPHANTVWQEETDVEITMGGVH